MGKWAKKKQKNTIKDDIFRRLNGMLQEGMGRSRQEDKKAGIDQDYIYSSKTYETYKREAKHFADWVKKEHPEVLHLKDLNPYANDYLQSQIDAGLSAWTITTRKAAIAKTLGIPYGDMIATPSRNRSDITRSRAAVSRDKHISDATEARLAMLTAATGLRRRELVKITGDALKFDSKSGKPFLHITEGTKGGKERTAWIIGSTQEETDEVVKFFQNAGRLRVCPHVSEAYDNHHYRAEYAKRYYNRIARPAERIPKEDRYIMRKDRAGEVLDKRAMRAVSKALGHNRIDVIAASYLYV